MMTKKKTSRLLAGLYFLLLPVVALILVAFARPNFTKSNQEASDSVVQNDLEFISPLEYDVVEIFSGFGERVHPVLGKKMQHTGVDFVSNDGDRIISTESGIVEYAGFHSKERGNFVVIKHDELFTTTYSHLKEMSVKTGDQVQKGQSIGLVGNTGLSTKSHLHYEIIKNGEPVDPTTYLTRLK